jgi:amino acid transporter
MGAFASLALTMSTICILAGGITSFPQGFCSVGGAAVGLGWSLCVLFSLAVALTMGQVVSAFPRAGGPCKWAAELGGVGWGWLAGCLNLAGLITALAAVNVGFVRFAFQSPARLLGFRIDDFSPWLLGAALAAATLSQAFINHRGIRLTTRLTNFSGYLIVATALALTLLLLVCAATSAQGLALGRLVTISNFSGAAGGEVWPANDSLPWLFALGLLLPAYTFTGFDAPAQTAEETRPRDQRPSGDLAGGPGLRPRRLGRQPVAKRANADNVCRMRVCNCHDSVPPKRASRVLACRTPPVVLRYFPKLPCLRGPNLYLHVQNHSTPLKSVRQGVELS